MADLVLPDRKIETMEGFYPNRKPVGNVKVNVNHPLAKELICFEKFSEGSENLRNGASFNNRDLVLKSDWGSYNNDYYTITDSKAKSSLQNKESWSVTSKFRRDDTVNHIVLVSAGEPSLNNLHLSFRANTAGTLGITTKTNGTWYGVTTPDASVSTATTEFNTATLTHDAVSATLSFYYNGKKLQTSAYPSHYFPNSTLPWVILGTGQLSSSSTMQYSEDHTQEFFAMHSKVLSDAEVTLLHQNPYDMLLPR